MTGIVYGNTSMRAKEQLEKIKSNYECMGIKVNHNRGRTILSKIEKRYIFQNGDIWRAVVPKESCRGLACNIAYIDELIEPEIVDRIIMPTLKSCPYQAYKYF